MDGFLRQRIDDLTTLQDADEGLLGLATGLPGSGDLLGPDVAVAAPAALPPIQAPAVPVGAPGGAPAAIPSLALAS
jgi:hypothetical protein